jgi:hypothetical protein
MVAAERGGEEGGREESARPYILAISMTASSHVILSNLSFSSSVLAAVLCLPMAAAE